MVVTYHEHVVVWHVARLAIRGNVLVQLKLNLSV